MRPARVISFDVWNTLLDLNAFYDILAEHLASACKRDYNSIRSGINELYRSAVTSRLRNAFRRPVYDSAVYFSKGLDVEIEAIFRAVARAVSDSRVESLAYRDAPEALRELKSRGYTLAVVGNTLFWPGAITRLLLHLNGLLDYIDVSLFSDEVLARKPHPEIFEELAARTSSRLNEIVHVGDSVIDDFLGAYVAGMRVVLVRRDMGEEIVRVNDRLSIVRGLDYLLKALEAT